jgi:hypothetical protein
MTLKAMPTESAPLPIAARFTMRAPPQKPVWKQFMVRKVPGFKASRRKRTIASISRSNTIMTNSRYITTGLILVSASSWQMLYNNLRNVWLYDILNFIEVSKCIREGSDGKDHEAYSHDPERYENALLPKHRLLFCGGHVAVDVLR